MKIWRIAVKELLVSRDVQMLIYMLATPVLLMLILGTVLSNAFSGNVAAGEIRVLYISESGEHPEEFMSQTEESGVVFERTSRRLEEALHDVRNGDYAGLMTVDKMGIHYYGNNRSQMETSIVNGLLAAYEERYKVETTLSASTGAEAGDSAAVISAMAGVEPGASYVKETSLEGPPRPSAMDYYAVAVTTMIIIYIALTAGMLIDTERVRNTATRLLAAPVSKYEIFAGKVLGHLIINALFVVVIVYISKYMYDANWGDNMGLVFLVLLSLIVFSVSIGLGISYLIKGKAAGAIIMTFIQLACLFGGSYHQIIDNGDLFSVISRYSPLRWSNDALLGIIYGSDTGSMFAASETILLNVGISAALLAAAVFIMRRREGL